MLLIPVRRSRNAMTDGPMSNEHAYAAGLLNRALDPGTQPPAIRAFLQAEVELLDDVMARGNSVIDVGCGTGRHLAMFQDRLRLGLGVDYQLAYLVDARRRVGEGRVHFVAADAGSLPVCGTFDLATCMTNTWGTMSDKGGVLSEMRRVAPDPGVRLLSVFSEASVSVRREWYGRLGHTIIEETPEYLVTDGGFRSEHFSETRLRSLVGPCTIRACAGIGYIVTF